MNVQNPSKLFVLAGLLALFGAGSADAAQTVHMHLNISGNDIECESTISSMERFGTMEASGFASNIFVPIEPATGQVVGRPQHRPIRLVKRIDKCTPLLLKALDQHETVAGRIRFFRPDVNGAGAEENFLTITIAAAHVVGMQAISEDAILAGDAAPPMLETVTLTYGQATWTYESTGGTYTFRIGEPQ